MTPLFAAAALALASFSITAPAWAQSGPSTEIPAEFPPASYQGRQYVDSRGCVYVRAGIDGSVTWVPRVTRNRTHLCGAQPTFAAAPAAQPAAPPETEAAQVRPDPAAAAPARPQATRPQATARPQAKPPASTPAPMRTVAAIPAARPGPAPVAQVSPPASRISQSARAACQGAPVLSQSYMADGRTIAVRCGPRRSAAPRGAVPGDTRIVPRHVHEARDDQVVRIPEGYRPAFDDDRLNRKRANQSVDGYRATQLIWTNTVPRRLIERRTGRDVTVKYPKLVYSDTGTGGQSGALSTQGQAPAETEARVSTKSTLPTAGQNTLQAAAGQAATGRYVQVGTFGVPANAERTARQLQGLGLPVRYGRYSKGGQDYRIVLAGPFAEGRALQTALTSARRAGFHDAFVR